MLLQCRLLLVVQKVTWIIDLLLFCSILTSSIRAELFTAMTDVESLLAAENELVNLIDQYVEVQEQRLLKLQSFAKSYSQKSHLSVSRVNSHSEIGQSEPFLRENSQSENRHLLRNPLNAFVVTKGLLSDWDHVTNLMKENSSDVFLQNITRLRATNLARFPTLEDLNGAAVALHRLQDTYQLNTADMAHGRLPGSKSATKFTAHDCFEVGRVAYDEGDYYHSVIWMEEALRELKNDGDSVLKEEDVLEYLAYSLFVQGNPERAYMLTERLVDLDPIHPRAHNNLKYFLSNLQKQGKPVPTKDDILPPLVNLRPRPPPPMDTEMDSYDALCRGQVLLLQRSLVFGMGGGEPDKKRIAKSTGLEDDDHEIVRTINRRSGLMAGLSLKTAETLQIANYGLGGYYYLHRDHRDKEELDAYPAGFPRINRIATVLFYLAEPEAGGSTVFPLLNLFVSPSKNDAVFWHNLFRNGRGDATTLHAGCPVLAGDKWVSNKWFHEEDQEFHRPCGLDEWNYE